MSHHIGRCDFIDMLEESATLHRPLAVTLSGAMHFSDAVRDVVTQDGEDYAIFRQHGIVAVSDILDCTWVEPRETGYNAKL